MHIRKFTKERRKLWKDISRNFNDVFRNGKVSQRGVSEQFEKPKTDFKRKIRQEESLSGFVLGEDAETEALLKDIVERIGGRRKKL